MKIYPCRIGCPGYAAAPVFIRKAAVIRAAGQRLSTAEELARLDAARSLAAETLAKAAEHSDGKAADIIAARSVILNDPALLDGIRSRIVNEELDAASAALAAGEAMAAGFEAMDNEYLKGRSADIRDVAGMIARALSGDTEDTVPLSPSIVFAEEITPEFVAAADKNLLSGIVTKKGSPASHTSILCGSYSIPYVFDADIPEEELRAASTAAIDPERGAVILDPDEETAKRIGLAADRERKERTEAADYKGRIKLFANISGPGDLEAVRQSGAGGIGLFRTEFLYMNRDTLPTEEEQFAVYKAVLEGMDGRETVIRTMDIGADKKTACLDMPAEENPALGRRAIRICLQQPELFRTQLRALLRAACFGNEMIMYPMIASPSELDDIREQVEIAARELSQRGADYRIPPQGIMVETPAAAILSDIFAKKVDFFSIGTNDLTQYTIALDRTAEGMGRFYDPRHEAVMRLIELTVKNAHDNGIWVGICGELGGDPKAIPRLAGMGVDELSMSPGKIGKAKAALSAADAESEKTEVPAMPQPEDFAAPADGSLIPMEEIPDPTFSEGMLGKCVAVEPKSGQIYSPCRGTVTMVAETGHAVGILSETGREVLVHVGIDTVSLAGRGFSPRCAAGDKVETGDILLEADLDVIRGAGLSAMVILAVKEQGHESI